MTYAEKLSFLMKLTATSNKQLAEAVKVDPSLISRLRRARRNIPKNLAYTRAMADCLARKCEGNYQRVALSEALGRKTLQLHMGTEQLAAILFDWLTDSRDQVGQFLHTFERFTIEEAPAGALPAPGARGDGSLFTYYGNEGKRGAIAAFMAHLLSLSSQGTVLLSTDESPDWLFEDSVYLAELQTQIRRLLQKGFRIRRIGAPIQSADQAFDSLTRWLPLYMTGQVEASYYPRLRDELYRRTLVVLPGVAAVVATSTAGQSVGGATIFTQDRRLAASFADEFRALLQKCRPMMTTYSSADGLDALLHRIRQYGSDRGESLQQSTTLSFFTTPMEVARAAVAGAPEAEVSAVLATHAALTEAFRRNLRDYPIVDVHALATAQEVRAGVVPIGLGTLRRGAPTYYTPETYALHLRSILDYVEQCENYRAVLLPRDGECHALLVKDGRQALLLRPSSPLIVFEIAQIDIVQACREYLLRRVESPRPPALDRQETISRLRQMIREVEQE